MPNQQRIAELESAISSQRAYMRDREISHDFYYTDPYGHRADSVQLSKLQADLEKEKAL